MALLRYIGIVKAEGVPVGLTGVYAYGLSRTEDYDLRAVVESPIISGQMAPEGDVVGNKSDNNAIGSPPEKPHTPEPDHRGPPKPPPTGYHLYLMDRHDPECFQPLDKLLEQGMLCPTKALSLAVKKTIARNMIRAVHSLAERQFLHLDIKPANFLVNPATGAVKLIDMEGIVNVDQFQRDRRIAREGSMSLKYCAPERFCSHVHTMRVGCVVPNPDVGGVSIFQELNRHIRLV